MAWKTINYRWQWQLKSLPVDLWPYIADTQRFNQAARLPYINYSEIPLETGGSQRLGQTSRFGVTVEFEDYPFDWVKEQQFRNIRIFSRGPIARTEARLSLHPNRAGTLLKYEVDVVPANLLGFLGTPYQFGWEMRRNFGRVFRQIDDYLQNRQTQPFLLKSTSLSSSGRSRLQNLIRELANHGYQLRWTQHLANLLLHEADFNLTRMRPYVLAEIWQAPRREILEMFLSAAKLGLLKLRWDIMCPLCRGAKSSAPTLDEVRKGVHCATCNIDFEADFARNVELTFTPHPQIRPIYGHQYCIGGPMVTPHILVHQTLAPGERRVLMARLPQAGYRFRTQRQAVEQLLQLDEQSQPPINQLCIQAEANAIQVTPEAVEPVQPEQIRLVMVNRAAYPQRIFIERGDWSTGAVTAAQVTSLQHFRDLFSDEVLRPDEEIGVQGMTILFSDLVGSTAMYNQWGDAPSYALVREQFAFLQRIIREQEGAIVKTIGDAIMAAFADPVNGVKAALAIQQQIDAFNATQPGQPLAIKLGMHHGPCIAVNLNGRLDYFGTTVNLAARLEGQSHGGDVVISEAVRRDPAVAELLASAEVEIGCFETAVKGFDEHFRLYRLKPRFTPTPASAAASTTAR